MFCKIFLRIFFLSSCLKSKVNCICYIFDISRISTKYWFTPTEYNALSCEICYFDFYYNRLLLVWGFSLRKYKEEGFRDICIQDGVKQHLPFHKIEKLYLSSSIILFKMNGMQTWIVCLISVCSILKTTSCRFAGSLHFCFTVDCLLGSKTL